MVVVSGSVRVRLEDILVASLMSLMSQGMPPVGYIKTWAAWLI